MVQKILPWLTLPVETLVPALPCTIVMFIGTITDETKPMCALSAFIVERT